MGSPFEKFIFRSLEEQAVALLKSITATSKALTCWLDNQPEEVIKALEIVSMAEHSAKKMKKRMLEEAAQAEANIHRTDFVRLILLMDEVSSYQGGCVARLAKLKFQPKADDPMAPKFKELVAAYLETGNVLNSVMKLLGNNNRKAMDLCEQLTDLEQKIDDIYRDLESHLYSRMDLDIRLILQIRSIAIHLEELSDCVEQLADALFLIISA